MSVGRFGWNGDSSVCALAMLVAPTSAMITQLQIFMVPLAIGNLEIALHAAGATRMTGAHSLPWIARQAIVILARPAQQLLVIAPHESFLSLR
jgi:hypothetical protein